MRLHLGQRGPDPLAGNALQPQLEQQPLDPAGLDVWGDGLPDLSHWTLSFSLVMAVTVSAKARHCTRRRSSSNRPASVSA